MAAAVRAKGVKQDTGEKAAPRMTTQRNPLPQITRLLPAQTRGCVHQAKRIRHGNKRKRVAHPGPGLFKATSPGKIPTRQRLGFLKTRGDIPPLFPHNHA